MRRRGLLIVLGGAFLGTIGVVAFLAQRPAAYVPPAYAVAKASEVTSTPRPISVEMQRGADRRVQRQRSNLGSCPGSMGCPGSTDLRAVTVFLVRDETGGLHAFIGEDPRNGCAIEWMTLPPDSRWFIEGVRVEAVFHDVCHGSLYDRRGQRVGGPSPWNLNELATKIREGDVYIDPGRILVGDCPGCPRSQSTPRDANGAAGA